MAARMSDPVSVSTGQPIVVPGADSGGWMPAAVNGRRVKARFVLFDVDGSNNASMLIEVAEQVTNGVAAHSEFLEKSADISCAPGEQKTYEIEDCTFPFVRLSAAGPSPSYPATQVQGGIEIIQ